MTNDTYKYTQLALAQHRFVVKCSVSLFQEGSTVDLTCRTPGVQTSRKKVSSTTVRSLLLAVFLSVLFLDTKNVYNSLLRTLSNINVIFFRKKKQQTILFCCVLCEYVKLQVILDKLIFMLTLHILRAANFSKNLGMRFFYFLFFDKLSVLEVGVPTVQRVGDKLFFQCEESEVWRESV